MNRPLLVRGLTVLLAIGAAAVILIHHGARSGPRARAMRQIVVGRAELAVPAAWQATSSPSDGVTTLWRSPDARATVTLGSSPASSTPLVTLARATATTLSATLPGFRQGTVMAQRIDHDLVVRDAFSVDGAHGGRIAAVQIWRRSHGTDLLATWTQAGTDQVSGAAVPAPAGQQNE